MPPRPLPFLRPPRPPRVRTLNNELGWTDRKRSTSGIGLMSHLRNHPSHLLHKQSPTRLIPGNIITFTAPRPLVGKIVEIRRKGIASTVRIMNNFGGTNTQHTVPLFHPETKIAGADGKTARTDRITSRGSSRKLYMRKDPDFKMKNLEYRYVEKKSKNAGKEKVKRVRSGAKEKVAAAE